jgi:phage-related tail protein
MIPLAPAVIAVPAMLTAIQTIYGISSAVNDFVNKHIDEMTKSENPTISRTGKVLEGAKCGFGLGYISSVVIIAAGQLLLGNTLGAITTAATAATLTNPIAMTCAAIGAIFYGWNALTDQERNEMIEKLSKGLDVGIELIKSLVRFVIDNMKKLFDSNNLDEIKGYISSAAKAFGKSLGDITGKISDKIHDTFDAVKEKTGEAIDKTVEVSSDTCHKIGDTYEAVKEKTGEAIDKTTEITSDTYDMVKETAGKVVDGTMETLHLSKKDEEDKSE